jgi:hypothetical protein
MSAVQERTGWDEPAGGLSPRSWYRSTRNDPNGPCDGFYLDYGPDHYRIPHEYCRDGNCATCQPGNVLGVIVQGPREAMWFPTVAEARAWVEVGCATRRFAGTGR